MTRRTKRRYAHEILPHGNEAEVRPLSVEVPYLYARAIGLELWGTGWFDAPWRDNEWASLATGGRTLALIDARRTALLADAMLQGLSGDAAWEWAESRMDDEGGWIYERAEVYGVPFDDIKPYPCGPEPTHHNHYDAPDARGWRTSHRIDGRESECPDCTEEEAGA